MSRVEVDSISEDRSPLLTIDDIRFIDSLSSKRRRDELTSWRALLRFTLHSMGHIKESTAPIKYNSVGAPYIVGSKLHIGVSHSSEMVAVIISTKPCAIDIERLDRDFERAAARYATAAEREIVDIYDEQIRLPLIWCAKECLYKLAGQRELDLLHDLKVCDCQEEEGIMLCRLKDQEVKLCPATIEGHLLVHTL